MVHTLTPWVVRFEQAVSKDLLLEEEQDEYFTKFNVDGLLRGDYQSRMNGYATGISNGFLSPNDIHRLENMDLIPAEEGGDDYYLNGGYVKLKDAGKFADAGQAGTAQSAPTEEPVEKIDAEIIDGNAVISITLNDTVQLFTYYYDGDTLKSADLVTTLKTEDLAQTYATTIVASGLYQNPRVEGNKVTVDFTQDYLATFSLLTKEEIIDMHISMNSEE